MKERKPSYPTVNGSVTVTTKQKKFQLLFNGKSLEIEGSEDAFRAISSSLGKVTGGLGTIRKISSYLSRFGTTIKVKDDKGIFLSIGRDVWTPLGHFSLKPRARKYLKRV